VCVGPKGEGGLDDATGAGGAGGASMKQTSASFDLSEWLLLGVHVGRLFAHGNEMQYMPME